MNDISDPTPAGNSKTHRPAGIILLTIGCVVGLLYAAYLSYDAFIYNQLAGSGPLTGPAQIEFIRSVLLVPLFAALGVGLWQLRRWAHLLTIGLLIIAIISIAVDSFARYPITTGLRLTLGRGVVPSVLLLYLLHPTVRPVFRSKR